MHTIIRMQGPSGEGTMTKTKKKAFSKVSAVKAAARASVGAPPPTQTLPDAKKRQKQRGEKHKTTLGDLLSKDE